MPVLFFVEIWMSTLAEYGSQLTVNNIMLFLFIWSLLVHACKPLLTVFE